jgi:cysteine desulfurase/selenocysteine lyase
MFDIKKIRAQFPILQRKINNHPLIYFDSAATAQKPQAVINSEQEFYENYNSNVHRGIYELSEEATEQYENTRLAVREFINAKYAKEIVFTSGSTEGINLVASCLSKDYFKSGDEVIISSLEHHSNIVPWQLAGVKLKIIPVNNAGELDLDAYKKLFSKKTKLVAVNHVSNSLGTINNVKEITQIAHDKNIPVLIDGAQAAPHLPIDVQDINCDFYVFSGHKMFGPTGIGILYGKEEWLERLPPYKGGGEMIEAVSFEKTIFRPPPLKFEAGTPNIAGAIGLGAAIKFLQQVGHDNIAQYEQQLLQYATQKLLTIDNLKIIGTAKNKVSVISFVIDGAHPQDLALLLDQAGIAIRAGHHCTMPLFEAMGLAGTARISLSFYNTVDEIDEFISQLQKVLPMLQQ